MERPTLAFNWHIYIWSWPNLIQAPSEFDCEKYHNWVTLPFAVCQCLHFHFLFNQLNGKLWWLVYDLCDMVNSCQSRRSFYETVNTLHLNQQSMYKKHTSKHNFFKNNKTFPSRHEVSSLETVYYLSSTAGRGYLGTHLTVRIVSSQSGTMWDGSL